MKTKVVQFKGISTFYTKLDIMRTIVDQSYDQKHSETIREIKDLRKLRNLSNSMYLDAG